MERDFMGLNSKDSKVVVKDEAVVEVCKESGHGFEPWKQPLAQKECRVRLCTSDRKRSGPSPDPAQTREPSAPVYSKSSAVKWPLSGADGLEGSKNRQAGDIQSPFSVQIINDGKQAVPVSMSHPFYRAQFGGAPIKQHGVAVPSIGSFLAGTTEPWYNSNTSCAPAQLTIFYGGMVNVYDDISPEKAQAIMFLAGNGASASTPKPRVQAQVSVSRTPAGDAGYMTQPISSPMSVSSHPLGPTNNNEGAKIVKGSLEQVMQSAIPQARKASLARFLSKRKERVMSSAPYNVTKDPFVDGGPSSMNVVAAAEN